MVRIDKDQALEDLEREQQKSAAFGGCVMCRLSSPLHRQDWIAENEHGVVVLDGYAATTGHLLVIAKQHIEGILSLDWNVFQALQQLVFQACRVLEAELSPERVYVATLGASRLLPMSFPHYHTHVVPVYATDERARPAHVFSWSSGVVRYTEQEAESLLARLCGAWSAHRPEAVTPHASNDGAADRTTTLQPDRMSLERTQNSV